MSSKSFKTALKNESEFGHNATASRFAAKRMSEFLRAALRIFERLKLCF